MSQGVEPPPPMPDDVGRGPFGYVGDKDSLISHLELVVGVVSSIIRDFDLKKVDALSVEEALTLMLQGTAFVRPSTFVDLFPDCFKLLINSFLFFGKWLLMRRAWKGGPALPRAPPGRRSLIRLRLPP